MSKNKNKTGSKWTWKKMLCAFLAFAAVVACVGGVTALVRNDSETISSFSFSRGDLDANGKYLESEQAIYTKEAFGAIGLRIEQDFDSNATYDVYYYDAKEKLVEAKKGLSGVYDEDYPLAKLARVVIHPEIPEDVDKDDFKINFFEVAGIANQVKITVDKDQAYKYETENLYVPDNVQYNKTFTYGADGKTVTIVDSDTLKVTEDILVDYENYDIYLRLSEETEEYSAAVVLNADSELVKKVEKDLGECDSGTWIKYVLELKNVEEGYNLLVKLPEGAECYIYGYND